MEMITKAILGGAMSGLGIGLCFINGGNSGGSDIIALIVTKYRNVSPGSIIMIVDTCVIASTILMGNGIEQLVYCFVCLGVFTSSVFDSFNLLCIEATMSKIGLEV